MPDTTTDVPPELLTLTEAAALLRARAATLRYWRHLGTGPRSFRAGRHVLYRRDDLHAWIDQQAAHDPTADQFAGRPGPPHLSPACRR